jgi:hypothetical protein
MANTRFIDLSDLSFAAREVELDRLRPIEVEFRRPSWSGPEPLLRRRRAMSLVPHRSSASGWAAQSPDGSRSSGPSALDSRGRADAGHRHQVGRYRDGPVRESTHKGHRDLRDLCLRYNAGGQRRPRSGARDLSGEGPESRTADQGQGRVSRLGGAAVRLRPGTWAAAGAAVGPRRPVSSPYRSATCWWEGPLGWRQSRRAHGAAGLEALSGVPTAAGIVTARPGLAPVERLGGQSGRQLLRAQQASEGRTGAHVRRWPVRPLPRVLRRVTEPS